MKLDTAMLLYAGGEGSGCNPEKGKCGRPPGSGAKDKPKYEGPGTGKGKWAGKGPAAQTSAEPPSKTTGALKVTDPDKLKKLPKAPKSLLGPAGQQEMPKQEIGTLAPEMKEFKDKLSQNPQGYKPSEQELKNAKVMEKDDYVVVMKPTKAYWEKTAAFKTIPVGHKARIMEIHPATVSTPMQATLFLGKHIAPERVNLEDITLLKKGKENTPEIDLKTPMKSKVATTYKTKDGASVTILKPKQSKIAPDDDMRGKMRPHSLKDKFKESTGMVKDYENQYIRRQWFMAHPQAAYDLNDPDMGVNVLVERDYQKGLTTVQQINTGKFGHQWTGILQERTFKNHGAASSYLSKRYGIKQSLPKDIKLPKGAKKKK